jgi:hypothetical protein
VLGLLEVADIGPPSSQESIVRASRRSRTNERSLWARVYGPSRDSFAYYHEKRRDCASQPMLMGRDLRSDALLSEGSVELTLESDRAPQARCANQSGRVREGLGVVGPEHHWEGSFDPPQGPARGSLDGVHRPQSHGRLILGASASVVLSEACRISRPDRTGAGVEAGEATAAGE